MKALARWVVQFLIYLSVVGAGTAQADQVYRDAGLPLSFRYPDGWRPVTPQLSTTRVLLYASDGSQGTCNVSANPRPELAGLSADQLRTYNSVNHKQRDLESSLRKIFPDLQVVKYWRGYLGFQDAGYIEFDHTLRVVDQTVAYRSVVASTFSGGHWFQLVCNAPLDGFALV